MLKIIYFLYKNGKNVFDGYINAIIDIRIKISNNLNFGAGKS